MGRDWLQQVGAEDTGISIIGAGNVVAIHYMPNFLQLFTRSSMPENFYILLCARAENTTEGIRAYLKEQVSECLGADFSEQSWERLSHRIYYLRADLTKKEDYGKYKAELARLAKKHDTGGNIVFTLAVPTECYEKIIPLLEETGLSQQDREMSISPELTLGRGRRVLVIEKPLGRDLEEVRLIEKLIARAFPKDGSGKPRKFRIDHYPFKEPLLGYLVARASNPFLHIHPGNTARVEAVTAKTHGVQGRHAYEGEGADMFQHLAFVIAESTAQEPKNGDAGEFWGYNEQFIRECYPADADIRKCCTRGRYLAGTIGRRSMPGYVDEVMNDKSLSDAQKAIRIRLETFFGFRFRNHRFPNTEFVAYSGKNLPERTSGLWIISNESTSRFSQEPVHNEIVVEFGPDPGIQLLANVKRPGSRPVVERAPMFYDPKKLSGHELDGYGILWNHALRGLDYFFPSAGAIEACAELFQPVIDYFRNDPDDFDDYENDTWPQSIEEKLGNCALVDYSKNRE